MAEDFPALRELSRLLEQSAPEERAKIIEQLAPEMKEWVKLLEEKRG